MSALSIDQVVQRLQEKFPLCLVEGGDRSEGYWIRCGSIDGNWQFVRYRLASPTSAMFFAEAALLEFYGA